MSDPVTPKPRPQLPSLCRAVIYHRPETGLHQAAVITAVDSPENVALHVFGVAGDPRRPAEDLPLVTFSEDEAPGSWSWPPRVG